MASASQPTRTEIASYPQALAKHYAEWLADEIAATEGPFRMALCGGHTPGPLYRLLAHADYRARIDWARLQIFWGDERFVPSNSADSNAHMARELWLDHVPLTPNQIHPMPTDGSLDDCAARYEALLKTEYGDDALSPARPLFDVVLLGVGEDGHTASLLPNEPVLEERQRWVAPVPHGGAQPRLTLTYPALASSRFVTFFVSGAEKARVVAAVRAGASRLPAARITSDGELLWFLDLSAARGLSKPKP